MNIKRTPWGNAQSVSEIYPGIFSVSTEGHGGYKLSRAMNMRMPDLLRQAGGWYEEDCEWAKVAIWFPSAFSGDSYNAAVRVMKDWYPMEYEQITGEAVVEEESLVLRKEAFERKSKGKLVVLSAWGSWHPAVPKGVVAVSAARLGVDNEEVSYWLVPAEEYNIPFVIDEERHTRVPDPEFLNVHSGEDK